MSFVCISDFFFFGRGGSCLAKFAFCVGHCRKLRLAEHVVGVGRCVHAGFCWLNLRRRDHLEDAGVFGMIILKWASKK